MTTASKRKGSAYERAVVDYLNEHGWLAERAYGAGRQDDIGDIRGIIGVTVECKAEKRIDLPGYLGELEREMAAGRTDQGVVVIKRRGTTDVAQHYAVMPMHLWVKLIKEAGY